MVKYTRLESIDTNIHKNNNEEQDRSEKDIQLYNLIKAKVIKKPKGIFETMFHPVKSVKNMDKTLKLCVRLIKEGANLNKSTLSYTESKKLSPTQLRHYHRFLNNLYKSAKVVKTLQITRLQGSYDSDESGYDSDDNSSTLDITPLIAHSDTTPLTPESCSEQSSQEDPKSEGKTSSIKKNAGLSVNKVRAEFKRFKKGVKRLGTRIVEKKQNRENTIPLSCDNPNYNLDHEVASSAPTNENTEIQVNSEEENNNNCLLEAIEERNLNKFKGRLESGADITIQDEEGNNILHLIASLEKKKKCEFLDVLIEKIPKEDLAKLINCKNSDGKTPLQIALIAKIEKENHKSNKPQEDDNTLQFIRRLIEFGANPDQLELPEEDLKKLSKEQKEYYHHFLEKLKKSVEKSKSGQSITNQVTIKTTEIIEGGYPLHSAVRDVDKNKFNELLQSSYDITTQDKDGNNVLHCIASLKGEQKVTFLKLLLDQVEKKIISRDKLSQAIKAKNNDGYTPIQVVLINKTQKEKHNRINPKGRDNTIKFCAVLLENDAKPNDLKLTKALHNKEHYRFLYKLEKLDQIPQETRKEIKEIRKGLEKQYGYQSTKKKHLNRLRKVCEYVDPARRTREILVITATTTVITMAAFAFFQGQIAIEVAIPIIAVAAVMCLIFTLGFSPIKKFFEKFTADEQNTSTENHARSTTETSNNDQQDLGNHLAAQKPSEHAETPNTQMSEPSVMRQFLNSISSIRNPNFVSS